MALTSQQIDVNMRVFGVADIEQWTDDMTDMISYKACGAYMIVAGLMSDAQELMAHGDVERARKTLNIAKHVLFAVSIGKLVGVVDRP
jgi:hypothetical protein